MKKIQLYESIKNNKLSDKFIIVDDDDYEKFKNHKIGVIFHHGKFVAARFGCRSDRIHRLIMNAKKDGTRGGRLFMARIRKNNKTVYLGTYNTAIEAAKAYDYAAKELHKEFALLNFKDTHEE